MFDQSSEEFKGDWIPDGFQVRKVRRPKKNVPTWANSDKKLKMRIFGPAMRRYRIAYLYWRVGMSAREVADELRTTEDAVEQVLTRLRRTIT
jgi:hypothetical protein